MPLNLMQTAIDPGGRGADKTIHPALKDTQGNILKSHGRDNGVHLFIRFTTDTADQKKAARNWLYQTSTKWVTTAYAQWEQSRDRAKAFAEAYKNTDVKQRDEALEKAREKYNVPFGNLCLSADGYRDLDLTAKMPDDTAFSGGAKSAATRLADPSVTDKWEKGFQEKIHALVILSDDNATRLKDNAKSVEDSLGTIGKVVHRQNGITLRVQEPGKSIRDGRVREHFGFLDGISQPLFMAKDIETAKKEAGGIDWYDPSAPLGLVLLKDPGGTAEGYGSYLVYRKLKQDVDEFTKARDALAAKLIPADLRNDTKAWSGAQDLASAYMVGRFTDGTPVISQSVRGGPTNNNNFTYDNDVNGVRCPFVAHTRKTNPRGDTLRQFGTPLTEERTRRIARRAVSYETTEGTGKNEKISEVGLLFMCVQSSVSEQFEFQQMAWSNNENFLRPGFGPDPVIGQGAEDPAKHTFPADYGSHNEMDFSKNPPVPKKPYLDPITMKRLVTMKGGEYFFMPSLSFLGSCKSS